MQRLEHKILILMFGLILFSSFASAVEIYKEDFELGTYGNTIPNWWYWGSGVSSYIYQVSILNGSLMAEQNVSDTTSWTMRNFTSQTSDTTISFKLRTEETGNSPLVFVGDTTWVSSPADTCHFLRCYLGTWQSYDGATWSNSGVACTYNTTYNIQLYLHSFGADSQMDVKVNGATILTNRGTRGTVNDISIFGWTSGVSGTTFLDDLCIETGAWTNNCFNITPISFHKVKIISNWTGNNIYKINVSITNGTNTYWNYTDINGIAYFSNTKGNYTYSHNNLTNYFQATGTATENNTITQNLKQSQISFNCFEKISEDSLTCVNNTIYPDTNTYDFTISVNGYFDVSSPQTITALQNQTLNITGFYSSNLTLTSTALAGSLTTCNYSINSLNETYTETKTGSPNSWFGLINDTYNVSVDCVGFETDNELITIINATPSINFLLYTTNSINFTFKDEQNSSIILQQVDIELISDDDSEIHNTTTGWLYVDLLAPTLWTIRYSSENYTERFYYFNLQNRTHTDLTLYLLKNSSSTITAVVTDETASLLEDAYLKILKYDVTTNSYVLQEITKTNFEGEATFTAELNKEFYKILVEYPYGTQVKETSPSYITSTTLNIQVQLGEPFGETYFNSQDISKTLIFNNITNNFRYTYNDPNNIVSKGCLIVYKVTFFDKTLYNSSCTSSSAATILVGVENITGTTYEAKGYVYFSNTEPYYLISLTKSYDENIEDGKTFRLFLIGILTLAFIFLGVSMGSIAAVVLFTPIPIFFASITGFINIDKTYTIPIVLVAIVISIILARKS